MFSAATWRLIEDAWQTPAHATWEAAFLAMFREEWGPYPLDEDSGTMDFAKALLALGWAGFETRRENAEHYVMDGWAVATGPHPPHLQRPLRAAVADLVASGQRAPPATPGGTTLHSMLVQFATIEGIVLPHVGLMVAMSALANGESPNPEDVMLEPTRLPKQPKGRTADPLEAHRMRKLRGLADLMAMFTARLDQLRSDPRTAPHMAAFLNFKRSVMQPADLDFSTVDVLPLENIRHGVAHFDLYLHDDGDVSFGWNLFTRSGESATRLVTTTEIQESQDGLVALAATFHAWSDFLSLMASGQHPDWENMRAGLTGDRPSVAQPPAAPATDLGTYVGSLLTVVVTEFSIFIAAFLILTDKKAIEWPLTYWFCAVFIALLGYAGGFLLWLHAPSSFGHPRRSFWYAWVVRVVAAANVAVVLYFIAWWLHMVNLL